MWHAVGGPMSWYSMLNLLCLDRWCLRLFHFVAVKSVNEMGLLEMLPMFREWNQSGADNHWLPTACAGRPRLGRHTIWRQTSGQGKASTWGGSQYNLGWFDQNSTYLLSKWHKVTLLSSFVLRHQRRNVPWLVTCGWFLASCATGIHGSCCTGRISWWMSCPIWRYLPCSLRAPCVSWHWSRIGR